MLPLFKHVISSSCRYIHPSKLFSRPFSSLSIPSLSFGTSGIAGLYQPVPEINAVSTLKYAMEYMEKDTFFDSALHYGAGNALRRFGIALGENPENVVFSIKVGRILKHPKPNEKIDPCGFVEGGHYHRQYDYSAKGTIDAVEQSLLFMNEARHAKGLKPIDPQKNHIIAFVHDPGFAEHGKNQSRILEQVFEEAYPALFDLKKRGLIKAMGVATNEIGPCLHAANHPDTDVILLAGRFTLLSNLAPKAPPCIRNESMGIFHLIERAKMKNIPIIVGGLANSGIAYGSPFYNYKEAPIELMKFRNDIAKIFDRYKVPISAGIIQFPLLFGEGAIHSSLIGANSRSEVYDAITASRVSIPPELWEELQEKGFLNPILRVYKSQNKMNKSHNFVV